MANLYGTKMKLFCIIILLLCLKLQTCHSEFLFDEDLDGIREPHSHEKATIACECGKLNKIVKKHIPWQMATEIYKNEIVSPANSSDIIMDLKRYFKNCSICEVELSSCLEDTDSLSGYSCYKNSVLFVRDKKYHKSSFDKIGLKALKKRSTELPVIVDILPETQPHHRRNPRNANICTYPTCLATAELKCRIYPNSVTCQQNCALGYTLPNGTSQIRECNRNTNSWQPSNFEECKPYVDCGVTLVCGGSQTCLTSTINEHVCCTIRCDGYEDKPEVPESKYTCDESGNWTPSLPFCVVKGSGMQLVARPQNY